MYENNVTNMEIFIQCTNITMQMVWLKFFRVLMYYK